MVMVLDANAAVTPVGRPLAVPIPVAPVVVCVMLFNTVLLHSVGVDEATPAVLFAITVTILVSIVLLQPPVPVSEYVITDVPGETAVITPVDELTVATAVVPDVHVPPVLPLLVNVVVPLGQMACVPLIVPALGAAVTVTVLVAVALVHPPLPVTV